MAVLVDGETRVVVQGITGRQGSFHTRLMLDYGTRVVSGVTPGRGGSTVEGVPVYDTVEEAVSNHGANTSIIFVPAPAFLDAGLEALCSGVKLVVAITERVPPRDTMRLVAEARRRGASVVGPNCPGVITPGVSKVGIMPHQVFARGSVGMASRSGTLTYEVAWDMTRAGLGQSTCMGLGGDAVIGTRFEDALPLFQADSSTEAIALIGEIGGDAEERAAPLIAKTITKPVAAYIAGRTAPEGKRMGHAGAIISAGRGTADSKMRALEDAGAEVAERPEDVAELLRRALRR